MDGAKGRPERILSAEQTALFEQLVKSLQEIRHMPLPAMAWMDMSNIGNGGGTGDVNIENIDIHVNTLADDSDYNEIAQKVGEVIQKQMMRGRSVGGILSR